VTLRNYAQLTTLNLIITTTTITPKIFLAEINR